MGSVNCRYVGRVTGSAGSRHVAVRCRRAQRFPRLQRRRFTRVGEDDAVRRRGDRLIRGAGVPVGIPGCRLLQGQWAGKEWFVMSVEQQYADVTTGALTALERSPELWKQGTTRLTEQVAVVSKLPLPGPDEATDRYFEYLQRGMEINRDFAKSGTGAAGTFSDLLQVQTRSVGEVVRGHAESIAEWVSGEADTPRRDRPRRKRTRSARRNAIRPGPGMRGCRRRICPGTAPTMSSSTGWWTPTPVDLEPVSATATPAGVLGSAFALGPDRLPGPGQGRSRPAGTGSVTMSWARSSMSRSVA